MSCQSSYKHIAYKDSEHPPKLSISNGWCIGELPKDTIDGEIEDILASSLARMRLFANVYSYNVGTHKLIKGHNVFFLNDPEHVGASLEYLVKSGAPLIYML